MLNMTTKQLHEQIPHFIYKTPEQIKLLPSPILNNRQSQLV